MKKLASAVCLLGLTLSASSFSTEFNETLLLPSTGEPPIGQQKTSSCSYDSSISQDVELYDGSLGVSIDFVRAHQGAVGAMKWDEEFPDHIDNKHLEGSRWCSGTLLPNNLFLTAGHCFIGDGRLPNNEGSIGVEDFIHLLNIEFNYQVSANGGQHQSDLYPVTGLVDDAYWNDADGDFVVLRLGANNKGELPTHKYPVARISDTYSHHDNSVLVNISHPSTNPKKVGTGVLQYDENSLNNNLLGLHMFGGSSGSGVLDKDGYLISLINYKGCQGDQTRMGGTKTSALRLFSGSLNLFDVYEFEEHMGYVNSFNDGIHWANVENQNWIYHSGNTSSRYTGPNNNDGHYLYFETSRGYAYDNGDQAALISHPFILGDNLFTFDYHMYGSDIGTLEVHYTLDGGDSWVKALELSGQQQTSHLDEWATATVSFDQVPGRFRASPVRIKLIATAKGGYKGDIAIDNLRIHPTELTALPAPKNMSYDPESNTTTWDPVDGAFLYVVHFEDQPKWEELWEYYLYEAWLWDEAPMRTGKITWVQACTRDDECSPRTVLDQ